MISLGATDDPLRLPDDLAVVQVGDLIHRGPDTPGVLVDELLARQPSQWIQLVGNHEAQYLTEPVFVPFEVLDAEQVELLRGWWNTPALGVAVAIRTAAHGWTPKSISGENRRSWDGTAS